MKENIVIKYRHTVLSYLLSTLIPWAFWLAASYVSLLTKHVDSPVAGIDRTLFSNDFDHYAGSWKLNTAKGFPWSVLEPIIQ